MRLPDAERTMMPAMRQTSPGALAPGLDRFLPPPGYSAVSSSSAGRNAADPARASPLVPAGAGGETLLRHAVGRLGLSALA